MSESSYLTVRVYGSSTGNDVQAQCIATVLDPTHVLLPAHCVIGTPSYLGVPMTNNEDSRVAISKIRTHDSFDLATGAHDIAILTVSQGAFEPKDRAVIADGVQSEAQLVARLPSGDVSVNRFGLCPHEGSSVCVADAGGAHWCEGASGAPLVATPNGSVVGILSHLEGGTRSETGCDSGTAQFTSLAPIKSWIEGEVRPEGARMEMPMGTLSMLLGLVCFSASVYFSRRNRRSIRRQGRRRCRA
jgi:hypothetical protein